MPDYGPDEEGDHEHVERNEAGIRGDGKLQAGRTQVKQSVLVRKSVEKGVKDGEKRAGVFVPLKTTLETRSRENVGKVHVTGVPAKLASGILK